MNQERIIYKIDANNNDNSELNILSNLKIIEYLPIHDCKTDHKLIVNKLGVEDMGLKLFIETSYLKVLSVDENKLCLKLPQSHIDFFDAMDDKCAELLGVLVNGETEHDITELYGQIDLMGYNNVKTFDITNIEYKSLIDTNTNTIKINIFSNTTIKQAGKNISASKINPGDDVRLVIGLDYISLLINPSNLLARTKIYSYFIDVSKNYTYVPSLREKIDDWKFTSGKKTDIFIKTNTTENDNFDVNTEIYNQNKSNNYTGGSHLEQICENNENNDLSSSNSGSIGQNFKNHNVDELENQNVDEPEKQNVDVLENQNVDELEKQNVDELEKQNVVELENQNMDELENQNVDELENQNVDEPEKQNVVELEKQNVDVLDNISTDAKLMSSLLSNDKKEDNNSNIIEKTNKTKNKTTRTRTSKTTGGTKTSKKQIINVETNENDNIDTNNKIVELENKKTRPRTRAVAKIIIKETENQTNEPTEKQTEKKGKKTIAKLSKK